MCVCGGGVKISLAICTVNLHTTYSLNNMGTCVCDCLCYFANNLS